MSKTTQYDAELETITADIAALEGNALTPPIDTERATRYLSCLYQHASLTGNLKAFRKVESAIDAAIPKMRFAGDLYLLKANLQFKLHRFHDVTRTLEEAPLLLDTPEGKVLTADLAFQSGRYGEARQLYGKLVAEEPTWDNLARLAHLQSKLGDFVAADRLYADAEDELTAKQMRSYAWVQLQRGLLDLDRCSFADAEDHYRRAEVAYSGYWLVKEHQAALMGARGDVEEAASLYEEIAARIPKPELAQALGKLYSLMGDRERSEQCYSRAEAAFLESANAGEVHYYHHLADLYLQGQDKPVAALNGPEKIGNYRTTFRRRQCWPWLSTAMASWKTPQPLSIAL